MAYFNAQSLKHVFPVNKLKKQRTSEGRPTLLKMLVVSLLVHAAVIYLTPSVDFLPQPSFQYFEIETVTIEPEEQDVLPEEGQASDQQTTQQPEDGETAKESVTPLSDYEPFAPDMVNEGREQFHTQLLIPQQHFTLPVTLESIPTAMSPQRPSVQPESTALDMAFLPARAFAKTEPETSVHETPHLQEVPKDVIVTAEQPYDRSVPQIESAAIQEALPELKRSQMPEVIEQVNVPSLAMEPIVKRAPGSDVSNPVRPTLPDMHIFPERPPLHISEAKALPQHLVEEPLPLSEIETGAETRAAAISTEAEPEFRPAQSVLLPASHSQDVIDISDPVLKSAQRPVLVMENLPLPSDTQRAHVRPAERLTDSKAIPGMMHEQIVRYAETLDRPVLSETSLPETLPEFRDTEFPRIATPVMAQTIDAPEHTSPALLAKSPQKNENPVAKLDQSVVALHYKKSPVQEALPLQKMLPSFQLYSTAPAIADRSRQEQRPMLDEEDTLAAIPRPQASDIVPIEEHWQPSSPLTMLVPRQVLMPQNFLASASIVPFISSEKTVTTLEDTFGVKKIAKDVQQPGVEIARQLQPTEQRAGEPESETLQRPQKLVSRPGNALPAVPEQAPSFRPTQRSFVVGAETSAGVAPAQPGSFGMFVRKDTLTPDAPSPQKTAQLDDALQQISTETREESPASLVIEGPASMRQVISKPLRLPEIDLDVEVTIRLQFWVLPDGTVGDVIPLQRGDVRLERAAIQYLKNWRFTPLASGDQTVWGIIPITYKLR